MDMMERPAPGRRRYQIPETGTEQLAYLLPQGWPLDLPLVKIRTCGCAPLSIEVLYGFEESHYQKPRYASPPEEAWKAVKARRTALSLLALLTSQPGCFASQDLLSQALRPGKNTNVSLGIEDLDADEDRALKRPDNVITDLRCLLYPPALANLPEEAQRIIRKALVRRVKASRASGLGYALASMPLIWLDVEAMEEYRKQAQVLEQFGESGQGAWQAVSEIGLRGAFLPHEQYSDWATWRRMHVRDLLWQSVQAQVKIIGQEKDPKTGEEVALQLLFTCWQAEPGNEDAFRTLAEKLGKQRRFEQAEDCYQQLCLALEKEGHVPHERTEDIMNFVRAMQIQHTISPSIHSGSPAEGSSDNTSMPALIEGNPFLLSLGHLGTLVQNGQPFHGLLQMVLELIKAHQFYLSAKTSRPQREEEYSILVATIFSLLGDEFIMGQFSPARRATLRRILAATSVLFPGFDLLSDPWEQLLIGSKQTIGMNPTVLAHFEHLLTDGWELSNINELEAASGIIASFLPQLLALDTASIDTKTAFLASQGLRLQSILAAHRLQLQKKLILCEQAVEYARIAGDHNTLALALAELAVAYKYNDQPHKTLLTYQEMLTYADQGISPLIQSRAYAASAAAFARTGRKREALFYIDLASEIFPSGPANDPQEMLADYGQHLLIFYHGSVLLDLGEYRQAWNILEKVNSLGAIPERNRLEIINLQVRTAARLHDLERYTFSLESALNGSLALKSRMRYNEAITILREEMPQSWWKEAPIKELANRFQLKVG